MHKFLILDNIMFWSEKLSIAILFHSESSLKMVNGQQLLTKSVFLSVIVGGFPSMTLPIQSWNVLKSSLKMYIGYWNISCRLCTKIDVLPVDYFVITCLILFLYFRWRCLIFYLRRRRIVSTRYTAKTAPGRLAITLKALWSYSSTNWKILWKHTTTSPFMYLQRYVEHNQSINQS